ncbi:hypothetical protein Emag_001699 [Eimeria magna]
MEEEVGPQGGPLSVPAEQAPPEAGGPLKQTCCFPAEEEEAPLPVFASGDPTLEQRLLRLFGALRLPQSRTSPMEAPRQAEVTACAEHSTAAGMPGATEASCSTTTTAAAAAAGPMPAEASPACGAAVRAVAEGEEEMQGSTDVDREGGGSAGLQAESPAQPLRELCEANLNRPAAAAAAEVEQPGEQRRVLSRGISATRAESPGSWSEATDSTGCTDSSDTVRPPPFGSWRHYSLADVPDEAMGLRAMQRACQAMLQQQRQRAAAAAAAGSGGGDISSNAAASAAAAFPDGTTDDPRVCVGPRRRS